MSERVAGRFTELRRLGEGGMGSVSLAHDHATGAACALKRVHIADDAAAMARLQSEFAALSKVRHPALVEVRDLVFERGASPVLVMEFVPGLPADQVVGRGDVAMLLRVALPAAEGLAALHDAGVVHGDIKPANLLVSPDAPDDVRLVDLGLAALAGHVRPSFAGTPGYAAPEMRVNGLATVATDLFAFGAAMHALLTGELPHSSRSGELSSESAEPPSDSRVLERAGAPARLVALILQLMASAPAERPRDALALVRALTRLSPAARRPLLTRLDAVRFVGRERELERILAAHRRSTLGPERVLVHAEPGMGKTALLDEAAVRLRSDGVCVATLSAAGVALHALAVTISGAADSAPPSSATLRWWLEDPHTELVPDALEALLAWLVGSAAAMARAGRPAAIVVDDFDRLDDTTRAALRRFALVSECRALHLWSVTRLEPASAQLVQAGEMLRASLRPLDRDERRAFMAARLGSPPPEALREDVDRHAAGHPARMLARLHSVIGAGAVIERDSGLSVSAEALASVAPSDAEAERVAARCAAIPGAAQAVLTLTLSPRPLAASVLLRLADSSQPSTITALLECRLLREEQGLLRLDSPALADAWVRTRPPEDVREARRRLLEQSELTAADRFRLLAAAGEDFQALEQAEAVAEMGGAAAIARQAAAIADRVADARACGWHLHAAREDRRVGRYADAEREYAAARALAQGESAFEAIEGSITARMRLGLDSGLLDDTLKALAADPPPRWRSALLMLRAGLELDDLPRREVLVLLEQACEAAQACESIDMQVQAARMRADTLRYFGHDEEALLLVEETTQRFREHLSANMLRLEGLAGALLQRAGRTEEAVDRLARAQRLAAERGEHFAQVDVMMQEASLHLEHGDWTRALTLYESAFRLGLAIDLPRTATLSANNLLIAAALTGDLGSFAKRYSRVRRLTSRWAPASVADLEGRVRALAEMARGRPALGRRCLERSLADRQLHQDAHARQWSLLLLARCEDECGALERAMLVAEDILLEGAEGLVRVLALAQRGLLHLRLGRPDQAEADLRGLQGEQIVHWGQARAHYAVLAAGCAIVRGREIEAEPLVAEVVARFEALPAPHEMTMALLVLTELAVAHGRSALPGMVWIEKARERAERLGNSHAQLQALELRERWNRMTSPSYQRAEDMTWLAEVSVLVQHIPHLPSLATRAMALACRRIQSERGVLVLDDRASPGGGSPDRSPFQVVATYGEMDDDACREALGFSSQVVQSVVRSGQGIRNSDVTRDPQMVSKSLEDMRVRFVICEPLLVAGRPIGAVYLQDRYREHEFNMQDSMRLSAFAQIMAAAIEQSWKQAASQNEHERLVAENVSLRRGTSARFETNLMIGTHESMQRVNELIERVAHRDSMVLITGESGTGKELVAQSLHERSPRRDGPFISINCGALPAQLIESELFGIRPDVASQVSGRPGLFERAHGGTMFLDEIAEMPLDQQVKLLRVLQTHEVTPVGGYAVIPVDVRVLAATNQDLEQLIAQGRFRSDLYFRLNVVPIHMPALRDRRSDLPALADQLAARIATRFKRSKPRCSVRFIDALLEHDWPGNVRELENYVERVMLMTGGDVLEPVPPPRPAQAGRTVRVDGPDAGPLEAQLEQVRRDRILAALESSAGNQSSAARQLSIGEPKLRYWMDRLGLRPTRSI